MNHLNKYRLKLYQIFKPIHLIQSQTFTWQKLYSFKTFEKGESHTLNKLDIPIGIFLITLLTARNVQPIAQHHNFWLCIFVLSGEDEIIPRYMQLMVDCLYHFICEKFQEVAAHHAVRLSAVNLLNKTNLTFRFYFYQICRNVGLCTVFYFIKNVSSLNCFYCLFSGLYVLVNAETTERYL